MSDDDLPPFMRALLNDMSKEARPERTRETNAKDRQMHAAVHGERETSKEAVHVALDFLAHDLACYLAKITADEFKFIEVLREVRRVFDLVRQNLDPRIVNNEGQVSRAIFVELRAWGDKE